ncbi:MAG: hypothetical protein IJD56_06725, partial [Peptococcaceae bacterium]|nr:hypothetical protein [Peptococcaceae bacterium]
LKVAGKYKGLAIFSFDYVVFKFVCSRTDGTRRGTNLKVALSNGKISAPVKYVGADAFIRPLIWCMSNCAFYINVCKKL